ncbi:MAG: hypothetical protein HPY69_09220 [Armatimonadetes bacterium]|nr:hypothetical protein [Armatimonadota bacterium]
MSSSRKVLLVVLLVLVAVLVVSRRHDRLVAPVQGQVTRTAAGPGGLYWIERKADGSQAALWRATGLGRPGEQLATAPDIRDLAVAEREVYFLTEEGGPGSGRLARVGAGGAPQVLADGLKAPQGLLVTTDSVYWAETRPAAVPGIACVPVLQPLSLIYAADRALQSRRLLVVAENAETHFGGKLLGERDGQLYWVQQFGQQYNRAVTTVSRLPVQGGDPEELVRVLGSQDAALGRSVLYWTAPSEERMPPESARTVYRRALAGGEPEKLTDWMALRGVLLVLGDRPLYCDDRVVWRVPDHLAEPVPLASLRVEPATVSMAHGTLYGYRMDEKLRHVVRCPLTLAARLRGLLRLI